MSCNVYFGGHGPLLKTLTLDEGLGPEIIYLSDCQVARPAKWARDPSQAERLWRLSERMVGGLSGPAESKL